ncbi:MAG TPA: endolytic transglycosylase MltG [Roseiarcus sp.]|nr:endolytic transglycosylase MltG [Roseiarcus sp.]
MSDGSKQGGPGAEQPRASLFGRRLTPRSPSEALQPQLAPPPPEPAPRKPRRQGLSRLSGVLSFLLIGAVGAIAGFAWALNEARKPGPLAADKVVVISREDEADGESIADQLERGGVIDSTLWFNLVILTDGARGKLKRGEYLFKAHASLRDVEDTLVAGKAVQHKLTVPEGWTTDQVVQRLRDNDVLVGEIKEAPREGSILPDTYVFLRGETRETVLARMEKAQAKTIDDIWKHRAADLPIKSPGELVTLASIVEKETGKPEERPRVAGVFVNRLEKRMKLQSDPTIVYGLVGGKGTLGHSISKAEVEQATPYNTYIIEGLPPGPIANPGKAALEAAANPARTKELYFVADGTGGHSFAESLDQHLKNVDRWRQIEKDSKDSKDRLSPDLLPTLPAATQPPAPSANQKKSELEPVDVEILGALGAFVAPKSPPPALAALSARLAKIGAERQARLALLGPDGSLAQSAKKNLTDSGVIVQGVNDEALAALPGREDGATDGPLQSYPLAPQALAEQQSREARFGQGAPAGKMASFETPATASASGAASTNGARPHVFDASEGTPLDPLLNTTYDLNYPKTVPSLQLR